MKGGTLTPSQIEACRRWDRDDAELDALCSTAQEAHRLQGLLEQVAYACRSSFGLHVTQEDLMVLLGDEFNVR